MDIVKLLTETAKEIGLSPCECEGLNTATSVNMNRQYKFNFLSITPEKGC